MLRVAYLLGTWPSPSETFLEREIAAVREYGIEVHLAAIQPGPTPAGEAVLYRPRLRPARRGQVALAARLLGAPNRLPDGAAAPLELRLRWLRNLPFAAQVATWCHELGCHLLHACWAGLPAQIAWMAQVLGGVPYSIAGHAHDVFCRGEAQLAALTGARGITTCNRAAWRQLARLPQLRDRLVYRPHGLDLDCWSCRLSEPGGPARVLAVGRLVPKKGFDTLLQAAAADPRLQVTVVGDGPERARLSRLAEHCGGRAELAGQLGQAAVRQALRQATVLALPSRVDRAGDRDGLANVILEAMATGVPVVTTAAGSACDAVQDGLTGCLVAPDDPVALAATLNKLLADAPLRARLAGAARRLVEQRFDLARNGAGMAHWLSCLAAERDVTHGG